MGERLRVVVLAAQKAFLAVVNFANNGSPVPSLVQHWEKCRRLEHGRLVQTRPAMLLSICGADVVVVAPYKLTSARRCALRGQRHEV